MIRSFGSKDTERIWHEQYVKRIDRTVQRTTLRKLELIHAAKDVDDLRIPPGNRLERLVGDRRGQHSIPGEHAVAHLLRLERWRCRRC